MKKQLNPSTIAELKGKAKEIIELPGFGSESPFIAELKRVSILELAKNNKIPNELLGAVSTLFLKGVNAVGSLRATAETLEYFAKQSLVSPSYDELEAAGIQLTDPQLFAIYAFATEGTKPLLDFREERKVLLDLPNGENVSDKAE